MRLGAISTTGSSQLARPVVLRDSCARRDRRVRDLRNPSPVPSRTCESRESRTRLLVAARSWARAGTRGAAVRRITVGAVLDTQSNDTR
jgi:hypothetical protein